MLQVTIDSMYNAITGETVGPPYRVSLVHGAVEIVDYH
ncbi:hypothetical protein J2W59_005191 [Pseudomonas fluorescens]|nr:hypothetical protein [Pseudomonas fluorescens]